MRVRLVRVKPVQKDNKLNQMLGVYRHLYNTCVEHHRRGEIVGASGTVMREWRSKLTTKEAYMETKPWVATLPSLGRQKAVEEFFQALKENLKRTATHTIKRFEIHKKK